MDEFFFYNLCNYLVIVIFLLFFLKFKKINALLFLILLLLAIAPFVMEKVYPSSSMYDIIVYYYLVDYFRDLQLWGGVVDQANVARQNLNIIAGDVPIKLDDYSFDPQLNAAAIMALVPIPFIVTAMSLGFTNKLIYIFTIVYLKNKKSLHDICLVIFLFYPSLIYYTSVGLKDTLVLCFSCLTLFFFINKRYFYFMIFFILLVTVKWTNALVFLFFVVYHKILFAGYSKIIKKFLIILMPLIVIIVIVLNIDLLLHALNYIRVNQWYADSPFLKPDTLEVNLNFIIELLNGYVRFFLSPSFNQISSPTQIFVLFENYLSIFIIAIVFIKSFKLNPYKAFFWLGMLMAFASFYGITTINFGTINRWKLSILLVYVFVSLHDCSFNEKQKKNSLYN